MKVINTPIGIGTYLNRQYRAVPHLLYVEKLLLQVYSGQQRRLILSIPPRHGKSELISRLFTSWYMLNRPSARMILTSYESTFAQSWGNKARQIYKEFSGENLVKDTEAYWETKEGGYMLSTGVGGSITGRGADLLIVDDPVKDAEQANSKTYRNKAYEWFLSTATTRLEPGGSIIIVQTRWNYDDLAGRVIDNFQSEPWELVTLPAIAQEDDLLRRVPGEALWPERFDLNALSNIKRDLGTYWFNALYQQQPVNNDNAIFKPEWWNYYDEAPSGGVIIQSWDTAFKQKETNDYSVCTTWKYYDRKYYLLDVWRGRVEYPDLINKTVALYDKWKPNAVLIEDKGSGSSLIQEVRRGTGLPVKAVTPGKADKVLRAHLITPLFEGGQVLLPARAGFIHDLIDELETFPYAKHDDQLDSVIYALSYLSKVGGGRNAKRNKTQTNYSQDIMEGYYA